MSYRYTNYQLILLITRYGNLREKKRGLLQIAPYMYHPLTPRGTRVYTRNDIL